MNSTTFWKAKEIVSKGDVIPNPSATTPNIIHFKVKQKNGEWCDVWFSKKRVVSEWSCNARRGDNGCIMHTGKKDVPYCSHTLAAEFYLDQAKTARKMRDKYG